MTMIIVDDEDDVWDDEDVCDAQRCEMMVMIDDDDEVWSSDQGGALWEAWIEIMGWWSLRAWIEMEFRRDTVRSDKEVRQCEWVFLSWPY